MPTVPRLNSGNIQEAALPTVRNTVDVSTDTFGGGKSNAAVFDTSSGLAKQGLEIFQKEKEAIEDAEFFNYDNRASEIQLRKEIQVKELSGRNAADGLQKAKDEWDKETSDLLSEIKNPVVRERVSRSLQTRYQSVHKTALTHASNEMQKYADENVSAYIKNARNDAALNYKDQDRVADSLMRQEAAIITDGEKKGVSAEVLRQNLEEARSKTQLNVLTNAINSGDDDFAEKYFKQVYGDFRSEDIDTASKLVEESSLRRKSQLQSDDLFKKSKSMTEALEGARDIEDPKLRDEVVSRIKQRFSEKKLAEDQDTEALHIRAANIIDQSGDVDKIPREDWSRFSLSERNSLKEYAKRKREGSLSTDTQTYYDLYTLASNPETRQDFARMNLMEHVKDLSESDFKVFTKLQAQIRSGKGAPKELDGFRSKLMIINDNLRAAGYDPTPKDGSDEAKSVANFKKMVDEQITALQDRTGKKASNEEVQAITDNLLVEVITKPGFIWDTKKRAFEVGPDETAFIKVEDIPKAERVKIESYLREKNKPITSDNLIKAYSNKLKKITGG